MDEWRLVDNIYFLHDVGLFSPNNRQNGSLLDLLDCGVVVDLHPLVENFHMLGWHCRNPIDLRLQGFKCLISVESNIVLIFPIFYMDFSRHTFSSILISVKNRKVKLQ